MPAKKKAKKAMYVCKECGCKSPRAGKHCGMMMKKK